jgi:hypothetical protein
VANWFVDYLQEPKSKTQIARCRHVVTTDMQIECNDAVESNSHMLLHVCVEGDGGRI